MRCSDPGHRVAVAIHSPVGVAQLWIAKKTFNRTFNDFFNNRVKGGCVTS
jgi:hypothetical protein